MTKNVCVFLSCLILLYSVLSIQGLLGDRVTEGLLELDIERGDELQSHQGRGRGDMNCPL